MAAKTPNHDRIVQLIEYVIDGIEYERAKNYIGVDESPLKEALELLKENKENAIIAAEAEMEGREDERTGYQRRDGN